MRCMTAGGSHGPELTAITEGLLAGPPLSEEEVNYELTRRQTGYDRGERMKIKRDRVQITSGIRHGKTISSPTTLVVENRDWKNWTIVVSVTEVPERDRSLRRVVRPRPGYTDLVDGMRYRHQDLQNMLERSSTRETTVHVAIGAIAKKILEELDVVVTGRVICLGGIQAEVPRNISIQEIKEISEASGVRIAGSAVEQGIEELIGQTGKNGDTIGGIVGVLVGGVPAGLGSYVQWDTELDAKIAQSAVSINAFKGVEFGVEFTVGSLLGSEVMDEILWEEERGYFRCSSNLGGFEGGTTNSEPLTIRGVMRPIPTLYKPPQSVDIDTKEPCKVSVECSDSTVVPVVSVVAENAVATVVATGLSPRSPSSPLVELKTAMKECRDYLKHH